MAKTTSPYNIPTADSERRKSQDSSYSLSSSAATSSHRASSYAQSNNSYDPDEPPSYAEHPSTSDDQMESFKQMEEERKRRIRDYAMQISRLMGKQLVNGLNRNSKHGGDVPGAEGRGRSS